MRSRLFIYLLLAVCLHGRAQTRNLAVFRHLDQKDGLLHNSVYSIAQDSAGFMWIGSDNGLQRYDGIRFKNYQQGITALSSGTLPANIYTGNNNELWFTCGYLYQLNKATNKINCFTADSLSNRQRFHFKTYHDGANRKYLLGDYAYYIPDSTPGQLHAPTLLVPNNTAQTGNPLIHGYRGETWICGGINMLFDSASGLASSAEDNPMQHPFLSFLKKTGLYKTMAVLLPGPQGDYWLSTWDGQLVHYSATGQSATYSVPSFAPADAVTQSLGASIAICMHRDSKGTVWAGTNYAGLLQFDSAQKTFICVPTNKGNGGGIDYNHSIHCITEDRDGNLWLGTDKGINIFHPYRQYFQTIHSGTENSNALPAVEITGALGLRNGDILITTWGGGFGLYDSLLQKKRWVRPPGPYQYTMTWDARETPDGTLWIGAQHGYLCKYYPGNNTWQISRPVEMLQSTLRCLAADENGNVYFGLQNGYIVKWDNRQQRFIRCNDSTARAPVIQLLLQGENLWASTENGLLLTDAATMQTRGRYLPVNPVDGTAIKKLLGLAIINDSIVVTGCKNAGMFFFNSKRKQFSRHGALAAINQQSVYAIRQYTDSALWFTTDYAVYRYLTNGERLWKLKPEDGRMNAAFSQCSFSKTIDGRWLTVTDKEVLCFNPRASALAEAVAPQVALTGIRVMDQDLPVDSLPANHTIVLDHQQNFISFYFSDFLYNSVRDHVFYHRLSGIDKDWVNSGAEGVATYTNLSPGDYVFEVKGEASATAPVTSWRISVKAPFYARWWFLLLAGLTLAALIIAIILRRIAVIKKESGLQQRIAEAEVSALRAQMNPHFIFNCLSAIDNMIETDQKDKATKYLNRFGRLIRSVLDSSKKTLVPLENDIETLMLYLQLEKFRCDDRFTYQLTTDPELLNADYKVPPLLVQPYLENAIHHGLLNLENGTGQLQVSISLEGNVLVYRIQDNGVGRAAAAQLEHRHEQEHTSYGMSITEERIRKFNKGALPDPVRITDLFNHGRAAGTLVEVFLQTA